MKKYKDTIYLGGGLILLSIVLHYLHFAIFGDAHHIFIFLLADIAFIPLEVFFVSLILERVIKKQEKQKTLSKTHMLVKLFYLEAGNDLLQLFSQADPQMIEYRDALQINHQWSEERFLKLQNVIKTYQCEVAMEVIDLFELNKLLLKHKSLLITLIANPMTLEHEGFSDALMSTFHLYDELERRDLEWLAEADLDHLQFDIKRTYQALLLEWANYMEHLSKEYPYIFTTALVTNPFKV